MGTLGFDTRDEFILGNGTTQQWLLVITSARAACEGALLCIYFPSVCDGTHALYNLLHPTIHTCPSYTAPKIPDP